MEHGFLTAQEAAQELKESEDLFFVNRMKACREVPIDGHFKAHYECADGFHAGLRHPKYGYPIYVNYFFQEKPHNLEFFKQILLTFEPLDKSTAPPQAFPSIKMLRGFHCAKTSANSRLALF